jgi:hypothetical protein
MGMIANKEKNRKKPPPANGFVAGKSGNPRGRPKQTPQELDLIAACKEKTPDALNVILDIMQNGEKEQTRLSAAQSIIERAYGKPTQPQDIKIAGELITVIERRIVKP